MKIYSKFLSYFKLDQNYSLLSCRDVNVLLEFFKALDVRETMALDGKFFFLYQSPPIRDLSFDQLEISLLSKFSMITEFKGRFTTSIRAILEKIISRTTCMCSFLTFLVLARSTEGCGSYSVLSV